MGIKRIIIFNLDSFVSSYGIRKLIETFPDKIVLIYSSKRFGGKYGSFWYQFRKNLKRGGMEFVTYQSLNLIWYKILIFFVDIINIILRRPKKIYSLVQLAKKYKIPLVNVRDINNQEIISLIKKNNPDIIISFYFDQVIRKDIINIPKFDVINLHTAMLPMCKGPFPILCSFSKQIEGGITLHSISDEKLDSGSIYKQIPYKLGKDKSILFHDQNSLILGANIVIDFIKEIDKGVSIYKKPQRENDGFYMPFPTKGDMNLLRKRGIKLFSIKEFLKAF